MDGHSHHLYWHWGLPPVLLQLFYDMKILFLDDDHSRIKLAKRQCIGHDLIVAETAKQAIYALGTGAVFDVVSLDHDLGGETMVKSGDGTGYEVAVFISQMDLPPQRVILHTFNPAGARTMWYKLAQVPELVQEFFGSPAYFRILTTP